jgi:hypothetical protein
VKILSPVLALLCHPRGHVRSSARWALAAMSSSAGHGGDIVAFVGANVDYVATDLVLKFPRAREHATASLLFSALVQCSTVDSVLHVTDVLDRVIILSFNLFWIILIYNSLNFIS